MIDQTAKHMRELQRVEPFIEGDGMDLFNIFIDLFHVPNRDVLIHFDRESWDWRSDADMGDLNKP